MVVFHIPKILSLAKISFKPIRVLQTLSNTEGRTLCQIIWWLLNPLSILEKSPIIDVW